ncbi:MAG: carboxyl-terminal protease [Saprospirales bacterium]|nr:carboxyl-terminal protease [Saprospirales bacterium]
MTEEKRKWNVWLPLMLSVVMVAGILIGVKMQDNPPTTIAIDVPVQEKKQLPPSSLGQGKLEELIRYIESRYVDDVDKEFLVKEAIDNILHQLDPHSSYISAEDLKAVTDQLEGSFDGIGIEFLVVNDTVVVVSTIAGGPARKAGILPGDQIVGVEDSLVLGVNADADKLLKHLKGEKGSEVLVKVYRPSTRSTETFELTRDKIPVSSVSAAYMLDDETGYIKVDRFSAHTYEEFMTALENMVEKQGMKHLVLDLRQNPGGYLQEAVNILSQLFSEKERLLVYTEGTHSSRSEYKSTGRNFYDLNNIAVLVDEGSASASEIVAGAIQDWDRGVIIGRRTFGKGLVQEQYPLRDGSAIRLTVARYFTPSGRCIQKPYGAETDYAHDLSERLEHGEMFDKDSIQLADTIQYKTNAGRVVFGGGGIVPDIFIPMDSLLISSAFISANRHIPSFTYQYVEAHRAELEEMGLDAFVEGFTLSDELLNEFRSYCEANGTKLSKSDWAKIRDRVRIHLKAGIAQNKWSEAGYVKVMNRVDPAVVKALEFVKKDNPLSKIQAENLQ